MSYLTCEKGKIEFGQGHPTVLINEYVRVYEPNGLNRDMVAALNRGDYRNLVERARKGVELLDCQVTDILLDAADLDEASVLPEVAMAIHEATGMALSLDSRNIEALRRTLDVYPFKPIINSVPCEDVHMQAMLPLVAQYGTAVILILTEEGGVPKTVDDRLRIAEKLVKASLDNGILIEDMILDPVVLPAANSPGFMKVYLDSVIAIRREFGCPVLLAGSNTGFGMPVPGVVDQAFIMAAMAAGVDLILVPYEAPVIPALYATIKAMDFLSGRDEDGMGYVRAFKKDKSRFVV